MKRWLGISAGVTMAFAFGLGAAPPSTPGGSGGAALGRIEFPNSGAAPAQEPFLRGVLLLHSFEYPDAREAFQQAAAADPGFALAYWGEAMTHNHPLWRAQDRDAALAALAKLAPTPEARLGRVSTERERGYLRAVEALFGEGDKAARDQAYSEAMGKLAARHPDDLEARAFYALSILGTAQGNRDFGIYMRAAGVAEEVFAANPMHPGAAHYLIHSYDDPVHAPLGLRAARVYAQIAPAASHAQHMISHIYMALGQWSDSVEANRKAIEVATERRERKKLGPDAQNYHALHWLEYSYLQLGRFDDARGLLEKMASWARESGSSRALWHLAAMRAAWVVETGKPAPVDPVSGQMGLTGSAGDLFATGYAALLNGQADAARDAAAQIGARTSSAASSGHLCEQTGSYQDTSKNDLITAEVMQKSLMALLAMHQGDAAGALSLMDQATAAEDALPIDFGPPQIVKPSHELYGEILLKLKKPAEARARFENALARAPRRSLSLAGLAEAAQAEGVSTVASRACAELAASYTQADRSVALPPLCGAGARRAAASPGL